MCSDCVLLLQTYSLWQIISAKSANCGNEHSAPSHNLYDPHENSIPFPHRDLTAAYLTSLSLLNQETPIENVVLYNLSSESYLNDITPKPCAI